jgi:uncharacterized protein
MVMKRIVVILTLGLILCAGNLSAQKRKPVKKGHTLPPISSGPRITAVARSDQDSIVIRWAPTTALGWLAGNRLGYVVERVTMLKDLKKARASFHRLTSGPIKPWSLEEWKVRISKSDRYEAVAVQALYGKSFVSKTARGPTAALKDAADELTNRYGFSLFAADIDSRAADGLGLRFVDKEITRGESYSYRIFLAGRDSLVRLDTAFTVATASPFVQPAAPLDLTAKPGEHSVTLQWRSPVSPGGGFTAFNIYRSADGGINYVLLNDLPFLTATTEKRVIGGIQVFTDTSAIDYVAYRYRVVGITPFADYSKPADVDGMAVDLTPPPPPTIKKPIQMALQVVRINWEMPATSPDLAGFVVSRSSFALKNYHLLFRRGTRMPSPGKGASEETRELMRLILPASARSFVDSAATQREPYYVVGAVDTAGNLAQSLPAYSETMDTARPSMPKGLAGTIDEKGFVHLHWRLGPERNIIGYRVMWANEPTHEFSQRVNAPVPDTVFFDSVNIHTLSHYVYYRVAAVSDRYIQSPLSEILSLRRPDVVAPASPVFLDVHVTDASVLLHWAASPSDDVAKQILSRRVEGSGNWRLLRTLGQTATQYLDTTVSEKTMYEYQIEAVDSTGLHSPPSPAVQARPYDTGIRPAVTDLRVLYDAKLKRVRLNWKYHDRRKEQYWFVIYRGEGQGMVSEYSSVAGAAREFQDQRVQNSVSYKYAVRVKAEGGAESPLSENATILLQKPTKKEGRERK